MIEAECIDTGKPMHASNVDYLVAIELRSGLTKEMGAEVAVFNIIGSRSIKELAGVAAGKSRCVEVKRGELSETAQGSRSIADSRQKSQHLLKVAISASSQGVQA